MTRRIVLILLVFLQTLTIFADDNNQQLREAPKPRIFVKPSMLSRQKVHKKTDWSKVQRRARPDSIADSKPLVKDTTMNLDSVDNLIYLERSNLIRFDDELMPGIQVLEGNVLLRHEGALLYCDSAYLDQVSNSFQAFGRVRMVQGDTLIVTAHFLDYDGYGRTAYLRENVKMRNRNVTLTSDSLIYNRDLNLGFYKWGGKLYDGKTTLVSQHGYYHADTKMAEFKYDVHGYNEDTEIDSDTLTYNTETRIAGLVGPTVIHYQDHEDPDSVLTVIYSDLGWYDTNTSESELLNHSLIVYDLHNLISGDTMYYDNKQGFGRMFHNISMNDTTNRMLLTGHYGYFQQKDEITLVTDSACITYYARPDTIFAHADTLYSFAVDTDKVALAYHNGRIYSHQYQAVSDSIVFNTVDSITHLMQLPILWSDSMQVTGDTIRIYPKGESIDYVHVKENAMAVQQEDTIHFNQLSGKDIFAFVIDSTVEHIEVQGNAESIFYPKDEGTLIGLNHMISSNTNAFFTNGELSKVTVFPQPKATLYPMEQLNENMLRLANFTWQIETRPKDRYDIFNRPKRATKAELDEMKRIQREAQKAEKRKKRNEQLNGVQDDKTKDATKDASKGNALRNTSGNSNTNSGANQNTHTDANQNTPNGANQNTRIDAQNAQTMQKI